MSLLTISYLLFFLIFFSTGMNSIISLDVWIILSFEIEASVVSYFKESKIPFCITSGSGFRVVTWWYSFFESAFSKSCSSEYSLNWKQHLLWKCKGSFTKLFCSFSPLSVSRLQGRAGGPGGGSWSCRRGGRGSQTWWWTPRPAAQSPSWGRWTWTHCQSPRLAERPWKKEIFIFI